MSQTFGRRQRGPPSGSEKIVASAVVRYIHQMRVLISALVLLPLCTLVAENTTTPKFDAAAAERFAKLALACVHKEYPNKISHTLNSDADVAPPRKLTPAFYGCYDWHSSVHGHWLLARLVRQFPEAPFSKPARDTLKKSLTAESLKQDAAYIRGEGRASFERPYGLGWLLQLCAELREWDDPQARGMLANLRPLEEAALDLGCPPMKTFFSVTVPLILPALASGWMLAFTLSLDDLVIASFTTGPGATTLPIRIYSEIRLGVKPEINAICTIMLAVVGIAVVLTSLIMKSRDAQTIARAG